MMTRHISLPLAAVAAIAIGRPAPAGATPTCNGQTEWCGDAVPNNGESCDEGSLNGQPGHCNTMCNGQTPDVCGDSQITGAETCDEGTFNGQPGHCSSMCNGQSPDVCGDWQITGAETCDEGYLNGQAGHCNSTCNGPSPDVCGDWLITGPEICDQGYLNGQPGYCNATCTGLTEWCGDGQTNGAEICDEGPSNGQPGHCNTTCDGSSPDVCGDWQITGAETCDDGAYNGQPGYCNTTCDDYLGWCGDGSVDAGEVCDDGASNGQPGYCDTTCTGTVPGCCDAGTNWCGDGVVGDSEECDDGPSNGQPGFCRADCTEDDGECMVTENTEEELRVYAQAEIPLPAQQLANLCCTLDILKRKIFIVERGGSGFGDGILANAYSNPPGDYAATFRDQQSYCQDPWAYDGVYTVRQIGDDFYAHESQAIAGTSAEPYLSGVGPADDVVFIDPQLDQSIEDGEGCIGDVCTDDGPTSRLAGSSTGVIGRSQGQIDQVRAHDDLTEGLAGEVAVAFADQPPVPPPAPVPVVTYIASGLMAAYYGFLIFNMGASGTEGIIENAGVLPGHDKTPNAGFLSNVADKIVGIAKPADPPANANDQAVLDALEKEPCHVSNPVDTNSPAFAVNFFYKMGYYSFPAGANTTNVGTTFRYECASTVKPNAGQFAAQEVAVTHIAEMRPQVYEYSKHTGFYNPAYKVWDVRSHLLHDKDKKHLPVRYVKITYQAQFTRRRVWGNGSTAWTCTATSWDGAHSCKKNP